MGDTAKKDVQSIQYPAQSTSRAILSKPQHLNHLSATAFLDYESSGLKLSQVAIRAAIGQKALDPVTLDVRGVTDIADFFTIVSGTSERHVNGIVDKLILACKAIGESAQSINGYQHGEWVIVDYGNVVVHVFQEPTRQYYGFDELWKAGTPLPLDEDLQDEVRMLRTGMI